jgi:hypothetical protein
MLTRRIAIGIAVTAIGVAVTAAVTLAPATVVHAEPAPGASAGAGPCFGGSDVDEVCSHVSQPGATPTQGSRDTAPDPCTYTYLRDDPGGGTWYQRTCVSQTADGQVGFGGPVLLFDAPRPEVVARNALAKIRLVGAQIGIAPDPAGAGLVGLPVWLWTAVTPNTWGPLTAEETNNGLTARIRAQAVQIAWNMGDGHVVTCANPGTPYDPSYGGNPSPTCGHTYSTSSHNQPGGRYTITANTTWRVEWTAGASSGVFVVVRTSQTTVRIDELQVVVR